VGEDAFAAPTLAAVAGLVGIAAALRFYGIGHQGFWFDEANTAQLVRYSPGKMLGLIPLAILQNGAGHDSWIATAPLGERLGQIVLRFLIGTGAPIREVLRDVAIALGRWRWRSSPPTGDRRSAGQRRWPAAWR
jgi:hypothetical protein